jgi:hypothetical protein
LADKDGYIFLRLILDTTDRVAQRSEVVGREGKAADEEDGIGYRSGRLINILLNLT